MMRYYITAASSCCRDQSLFLSGDTHIYLFIYFLGEIYHNCSVYISPSVHWYLIWICKKVFSTVRPHLFFVFSAFDLCM